MYMKNLKTEKPIGFSKLKIKPITGLINTRFNEMKVMPRLKIRERPFYKCITQF